MTDINANVNDILNKLPYNVVFRYPKSFNSIPVISFFTLSDTVGMTADNTELLEDGNVQIDVWAKNPKQCTDISIEINTLMEKEMWTRYFLMDMERECDVYHRTIRYNKIFTTNN